MSNRDFRIYFKFDTNAKAVMKELGVSSSQLDAALRKVGMTTKQTDSGFDAFTKKLAAASATYLGVATAIENLHGALGQLTAEYQKAVEVETKLAQVMGNTMGATQAEVDAVIALTDAQEELGVVAGDVQIAGAQELGTYLSKAETLKTLIPVMNDMVAQQYGINASQEAAVGIATMMGKVMEGQTSALKRYGYSFDETQEAILKTGTEMERAAVLAEVITASVGGMNEELGKTDAGRMAQLTNVMGRAVEYVGGIAVHLQPWTQIATTISTTGSAVMMLGTAAKGLYAVSLGKWATAAHASFMQYNDVVKRAAAISGASTRALWLQVAAQKALNIAVKAAPWALAVVAIGAVVNAYNRAKEAAEVARAKMEAAQAAVKALREEQNRWLTESATKVAEAHGELDSYMAALKNFNGTKADEKKIVTELNGKYGEAMGYFKSVSEWYQALTANSKDYCAQIERETRIAILRDRMAALSSKMYGLMYDENGNKRVYSDYKVGNMPSAKEYAEGLIASIQKDMDTVSANIAAELSKTITLPVRGASSAPSGASTTTASTRAGRAEKSPVTFSDALVNDSMFYERLDQFEERRKDLSEARKTATARELALIDEALGRLDRYQEIFTALRKGGSGLTADSILSPRTIGRPDNLSPTHAPLALRAAHNPYQSLSELPADLERATLGVSDFTGAWGGVKGIVDGVDKLSEALNGNASAWDTVTASVDAAISIYNSVASVIQLVDTISRVASANKVANTQQEVTALNRETGAQMINASAGALSANAKIPVVGVALGIAAIAAMIAAMATVPKKFAKGGVIHGPTLGLVGEYEGAGNNPEVIAPLSTLRRELGLDGGSSGGSVKTIKLKAEAGDLVAVIDNNLLRRMRLG